ncbi:MAG: ABC transporter permease [Armatimonadota bacterium]|nr:ABC transporter permease [Armatimonadota bacterium]MDR7448237.1 ABC transporter permease [Armatimonadota bacterium]MDR7458268.1 ABC transporter permease [Armatimonadota bacterium]MDR7478429.1 ABC transporter permease [Armatimonadota bacterium]MDR7487363.1 ABC transporter permease [Armatimonadota bacterium]
MSTRGFATSDLPLLLVRPAPARGAWVRLRRRRTAVAGLVILLGLFGASVLAPVVLPADPNEADFTRVLQPPSWPHPMGTDQLGRDILTRVAYGGRLSLLIGLLAVLLAAAVGVPIGLVSGYFGGMVDMAVQRIIDLLLAFPGFLLALTLIAVLGVGVTNVVVSVAVAAVPVYVRLVRGVTLSLREETFIEAARALGAPEWRVLARHVLPNSVAPVIVQSTLQLGTAILTAAGLGFLGLGVRPPTPEWGTMLGEGQTYLLSYWFIATFPGLAIFLAVMAFNLLGDGLRDALDPRTVLRA